MGRRAGGDGEQSELNLSFPTLIIPPRELHPFRHHTYIAQNRPLPTSETSQLVTSCVDGARRRLPVSCSYSGQYVALSKSNSLELDDIQSRASVENVCSVPQGVCSRQGARPKQFGRDPGSIPGQGVFLFLFFCKPLLPRAARSPPHFCTSQLHCMYCSTH
jgi:hypothetical protein